MDDYRHERFSPSRKKGLEEDRYYYALVYEKEGEPVFPHRTLDDGRKIQLVFSTPENVQHFLAENGPPEGLESNLMCAPYKVEGLAVIAASIGASGLIIDDGSEDAGFMPLFPGIPEGEINLSRLRRHRRYYILSPNPEDQILYFIDHGWGRLLPIFRSSGAARRYSQLLGRPRIHMQLMEEVDPRKDADVRTLQRLTAGAYAAVEVNADSLKNLISASGVTHYVINPDANTTNESAVSVRE